MKNRATIEATVTRPLASCVAVLAHDLIVDDGRGVDCQSDLDAPTRDDASEATARVSSQTPHETMSVPPPIEPLTTSVVAIMYFGDVVFAISGALTAARHRMDVMGFVLIGTITGIGGGTIRDLLLGRTVWWTENPIELIICMVASLATFFWITTDISRRRAMIWSDALGLAAFGVVGCHIALEFGSPFVVAVFMGMVTATGGGLVRDVLTNTRPMILCGEPYATAALLGSLSYAGLIQLSLPEGVAECLAFLTAFALRASAIIFRIRMGPPGEFIRLGERPGSSEGQGGE